ncbi:MAG: hypothetical protein K8I02_12125, partial [Candidatus Methylomirabilis sp.]|nr:hypothetical protein [Deltaproteobacteria bacterium]
MANVGDVNLDGIDDLAVGAPAYEGAGGESGRVEVRSGASGVVLLVAEGASNEEDFGWSVAGVGDVDGDGRCEFVAGAPAVSGAAGRARLLSGLDASTVYAFTGAASGTEFGASVDGAGDVDDDGVPDFIVGEPSHCSAPPCVGGPDGTVHVYSGADGQSIHTWTGISLNPLYKRVGRTVSRAGDVNADGFDDVMFSFGDLSGAMVVMSGDTGLPLFVLGSGPTFGDHLASPGDLNGDGRSELIASQAFGVVVYSGATGAPLQLLTTTGVDDLAAAGDVDLNAVPDYSYADTTGLNVRSGVDGSDLYAVPPTLGEGPFGGITDFEFGRAIANAGDLDGDDVPEQAIGAPSFGPGTVGGGRVFVYSLKGACTDLDGDGWGAPLLPECGFAGDGDCDDFEPSVNPGAAETCNGVDDDC